MFTSTSLDNNGNQAVQITEVDTSTRRAKGFTRRQNLVDIDLRYHVGGALITPAVGEIWLIVLGDSGLLWRLVSRVPQNAEALGTEAVEGMTQIGSSGPTVISGTHVAVPPLQLPSYATADRPAATGYQAGTAIYDRSLHKPLFSDGAVWRDSTGTAV